MKRAIVALLCASLLAATPQRPTPDIPQTSESIEVSIVNVDVFVTERGKRIGGLTKDDFEIYEDGKLQPITNFTEYQSDVSNENVTVEGGAAAVPAVQTRQAAPRQRRTLVVFIDRFNIPTIKSEEVFVQLKQMLHKAVRPGDSVTIVSWVHRLFTRLPFTDDVAAIDRTLDRMAKEFNYSITGSYQQIEEEQEFEQQAADFFAGTTASPSTNPAAAPEKMPTLEQLDASTNELHDMQAKTKALKAVIESISGIEGQKSMIFVSRRFSMYAGREYLADRHQVGGPPGLYEQMMNTRKEVESVAQTANAHGVTMYMLNPAGLDNDWVQNPSNRRMPGTNDAAISAHSYMTLDNEVQALQFVAEQTGGQAAWGAQDVIKLLPSIEQDFSSYYSLAYHATTHRQDRARKIVVKTKNRAYAVRARRQFVEQSDETKMRNRVVATLYTQPDDTKIPLRVRLGAAKPKGSGQFILPVLVEIPVQSLISLPDAKGQRGAFSIYIAWGDILGAVSDVTQRTQPFTISDVEHAKNGKFGYQFDLVTDNKANRVAIGVYDEISKDFGLQRIELPHALRQ
jgi:VWFA-related protein